MALNFLSIVLLLLSLTFSWALQETRTIRLLENETDAIDPAVSFCTAFLSNSTLAIGAECAKLQLGQTSLLSVNACVAAGSGNVTDVTRESLQLCPVGTLMWIKYNSGSSCPYPLKASPSTNDAYPCTLSCRLSFYTEDEYDTLDTYFVSIGIVSFIFISYTLASVLSTEKKRSKRMIVLMVFSSWGANLAIIVQAIAAGATSFDEVLCSDEVTAVTQSDFSGSQYACIFQGVMICYFTFSLALWWFCNIIHLFLQVGAFDTCFKKHQRITRHDYSGYWIYYAGICFGVPLITVIVLAAADQFGYYGPLPYCFTDGSHAYITWLTFYGPVIALWAIGLIALMVALVKICDALRGINPTLMHKIQIYYVQIMFIAIFSFMLMNIMVFRLQAEVKSDDWEDSGIAWAKCLMGNWLQGIQDPANDCRAQTSSTLGDSAPECGCGEVVPDKLDLWMVYLISTTVSCQGFFIFCIYGLNSIHIKDWITVLKSCCNRSGQMSARNTDVEINT